MTEEEQRLKHMDMIQAVITRMAENSFLIKGWSITLISALFALAANDTNEMYAVLALLPALCFWGLDAYYLRQERLYRKLYDYIRPGNPKPPAPSKAIEIYSMNTQPLESTVATWLKTAKSGTVAGLHLPIVLAVIAVTVAVYAGLTDKTPSPATPSAQTTPAATPK